MDDRVTTELHKVTTCCRDKKKIGLLLKNFHQRIPFCIWNFERLKVLCCNLQFDVLK